MVMNQNSKVLVFICIAVLTFSSVWHFAFCFSCISFNSSMALWKASWRDWASKSPSSFKETPTDEEAICDVVLQANRSTNSLGSKESCSSSDRSRVVILISVWHRCTTVFHENVNTFHKNLISIHILAWNEMSTNFCIVTLVLRQVITKIVIKKPKI